MSLTAQQALDQLLNLTNPSFADVAAIITQVDASTPVGNREVREIGG